MVGGLFGHNPLLDYRLPATNVHWWSVMIDPDTFMTVGTGERLWLGGSVEPRYDMLAIDEQRYVDLSAIFWTWASASNDFRASAGPIMSADIDWYPTHLPISLGTNSYARVELDHGQEPGYWSYDDPPVWHPGYNDNSWAVSTETELGPAFGRLRDATPVLAALLIGEALAKEKVLAAPMNEDAVQALARVLAGDSRFYYSHDANHSTKFFYAEIERVLVATGCITGRLPARAWLRIREVVGRQPLLDDRSWLSGAKLSVRCGVGAGFSQYSNLREGRHEANTNAYADFSGLAKFTFGYPLTTRLHLSGTAEANHEPYVGHEDATADVALSYLLPDRMLASVSGWWRLTRDNLDLAPMPVLSQQSASVGVSLRSYVEDQSTLTVGVSYDESGSQSGTSSPWQRDWGLNCSISLRRYF